MVILIKKWYNMELSEKQSEFYRKWETRRQHKARYFLIHGVLLRGLIFAIIIEFISSDFTWIYFDWLEFLIFLVVGSLIGVIGAYFQYRRIERDYQELKTKGELK